MPGLVSTISFFKAYLGNSVRYLMHMDLQMMQLCKRVVSTIDVSIPCYPLITLIPNCLVKPYIKRTLAILTELLDEVRHQGTKSKLVVYQAVQDPVEVSLKLFPIYIQQPGIMFN